MAKYLTAGRRMPEGLEQPGPDQDRDVMLPDVLENQIYGGHLPVKDTLSRAA